MNREDLEHIIRAAATVTNEYEFVIVGSQSILGPIPYPPAEFKMSAEADIYPMNAEEKTNLIDGALGEGSYFHTMYGYYAQGVDSTTATLPEGWKNRVTRVQTEATEGKVGYCIDTLDLFMSKAVANRDKDRDFNTALFAHGLVTEEAALKMVPLLPVPDDEKKAIRARIRRWAKAVSAPIR